MQIKVSRQDEGIKWSDMKSNITYMKNDARKYKRVYKRVKERQREEKRKSERVKERQREAKRGKAKE
jgi:hypothetical protein